MKIGDCGLRRREKRKELRSEGSLWPEREYPLRELRGQFGSLFFFSEDSFQSSCGEIVLNAVEAFADKYSGFDTTLLTQ